MSFDSEQAEKVIAIANTLNILMNFLVNANVIAYLFVIKLLLQVEIDS